MITYLIIGITVVLSFICFSNRELFMKLAFIPYRTIRNHEYYRIVTHGFIHADMTHLLVNMFTFWSFGLYIERTFRYMGFGSGAYLAFYFGGMIVASLYDLIKRRNDPYYVSIGASGAVSAVLLPLYSLILGERSCFSPCCLSPESYSACYIWPIASIWRNKQEIT